MLVEEILKDSGRQAQHEPARSRRRFVAIEVSPGEYLDRLVIARIKSERARGSAQIKARAQYEALAALLPGVLQLAEQSRDLIDKACEELALCNMNLWNLENEIRALAAAERFGPDFQRVALAIANWNDLRAAAKQRLDEALGALAEEKCYGG